jgi:CopG family nickel-responsive transcriptional regulator
MTDLTRFSVSLDSALVDKFDKETTSLGYQTRSKAIGDLIRDSLVKKQWTEDAEVAGAITLVYDHHKRNIQALLTDIQHDHGDLIISTMHVHLDHHNCMEVMAVRGRAYAVKKVADSLIAAKGVKHGKLTVTTTGKEFGE